MVEIEVTIQRSEHPGDDRLVETITCRIDVDVVPREGETLELPWPLYARTSKRVTATVDLVTHSWIGGDLVDGDELILVLRPSLVATLMDIDLDEGW